MLKLVGSLKVLDVLKINPSSLATWAEKVQESWRVYWADENQPRFYI